MPVQKDVHLKPAVAVCLKGVQEISCHGLLQRMSLSVCHLYCLLLCSMIRAIVSLLA